MEACEEAGLPDGVLNFVTGGGSTVGNALVESPKTRLIAFTGSRDVGVEISEKAGKVPEGQIWIKRAVLEMGGKDFILVDETADLEEAAKGVVAAAFGFQGQKCSACSRLIVHKKVHKELLAKVVAKTKALTVGDVRDPKNSRRRGHQRRRAEEDPRVRRRRAARKARSSRAARPARRAASSSCRPSWTASSRTPGSRRRRSSARPRRHPRQELRRGHPGRQRDGVRPDRLALLAGPRRGSSGASASSSAGTST